MKYKVASAEFYIDVRISDYDDPDEIRDKIWNQLPEYITLPSSDMQVAKLDAVKIDDECGNEMRLRAVYVHCKPKRVKKT